MVSLQRLLDDIAGEIAGETERGRVANYIPDLAQVDPHQFGISVFQADGRLLSAGDATVRFSIQSISKVFTLCLALDRIGERVWQRVGREPSGDPFNSIVQLEADHGIPRNPLINAGALVITDILLGDRQADETVAQILAFMSRIAGDDIGVDAQVARSEKRTGFRNAALANFLRASNNLHHDPELTLTAYYQHCAITMSCEQLAHAGRFLAFDGKLSPGGIEITSVERARRINALMLTCGHYDGSGDFAYQVGLPGKSGVGGGILAVVPGVASIAVWSPGLNEVGNSQLGTRALQILSEGTGWSVFGVGRIA